MPRAKKYEFLGLIDRIVAIREAAKLCNEKYEASIPLDDYNTNVVRNFIAWIQELPENTPVPPLVFQVWSQIPEKWLSGDIPEIENDPNWMPCAEFGSPNLRNNECKQCKKDSPDEFLKCIEHLPPHKRSGAWFNERTFFRKKSFYYGPNLKYDEHHCVVGSPAHFMFKEIDDKGGFFINAMKLFFVRKGLCMPSHIRICVLRNLKTCAEREQGLFIVCGVQGDNKNSQLKEAVLFDASPASKNKGKVVFYDLTKTGDIHKDKYITPESENLLARLRKRVVDIQKANGEDTTFYFTKEECTCPRFRTR